VDGTTLFGIESFSLGRRAIIDASVERSFHA
jgi:hypothetical protein